MYSRPGKNSVCVCVCVCVCGTQSYTYGKVSYAILVAIIEHSISGRRNCLMSSNAAANDYFFAEFLMRASADLWSSPFALSSLALLSLTATSG